MYSDIVAFSVLRKLCSSSCDIVILTATDGAVLVPGGYVVPLNGSITLKCHATMLSSLASLHWNITLKGSTSVRGSSGTLISIYRGKYSVPDGLQTNNPTLLRIHNLQLQENGSTVQCVVPTYLGGYFASSPAQVVFVEGELFKLLHTILLLYTVYTYAYLHIGAPLCPNVNIIITTMNSIISWHLEGHVLLPIAYTISVRTLSEESILSQNTSQTYYELSGKGIPPFTNYTVAVVACTRIGCAQNCDHMLFSIPPEGKFHLSMK